MPKISIVLPTFNGSKWLDEAITSIIHQTETNWELIIVDDCSTDNTLTIAESFAAQDRRIIVISNEINQKLPESLNIGFRKSRGQYLTWTSDDNILKESALKELSSFLDNHQDIDLISMNHDFIDENDNIIGNLIDSFQYSRCAPQLLINCNIGAAFMYRRKLLCTVGLYDISMFCGEDYDYWCRTALSGKIAYRDTNIYQYRRNKNSLSWGKQNLMRKNTKDIQIKYAQNFFQHYKYTLIDQTKFWVKVSVLDTPLKLVPIAFLILIYKYTFKIIVTILPVNRIVKKIIEEKFNYYNTFSFSVKKS